MHDTGDDDRHVVLLEERRHRDRLLAAHDDRLEFHLLGEGHGVADIVGAIGHQDHRHLAVERRQHRLEHDVASRAGERLILCVGRVRLAVRVGVVQQRAERIHLQLSHAIRIGVPLLRDVGAREAASAESGARELDDERDALVPRPERQRPRADLFNLSAASPSATAIRFSSTASTSCPAAASGMANKPLPA